MLIPYLFFIQNMLMHIANIALSIIFNASFFSTGLVNGKLIMFISLQCGKQIHLRFDIR